MIVNQHFIIILLMVITPFQANVKGQARNNAEENLFNKENKQSRRSFIKELRFKK